MRECDLGVQRIHIRHMYRGNFGMFISFRAIPDSPRASQDLDFRYGNPGFPNG